MTEESITYEYGATVKPKKSKAQERREERIKQLKAKLQKEQARMTTARRKERNAYLYAFGVMCEAWGVKSHANFEALEAMCRACLNGRTLDRALLGLEVLKERVACSA